MPDTKRTCRLIKPEETGLGVLVINTPAGKPRRLKSGAMSRVPMHVSVYLVTDLRPDKRVAYPAFRLQKLTGDHEFWDVYVTEFGATCSCPDQDFRADQRAYCKHAASLRAVGLLSAELVEIGSVPEF
jgi:hypothetical protein